MSPADDLSRRGLRVPRKHVRRLEKHNGPVVTEEQIFLFVTDVLFETEEALISAFGNAQSLSSASIQ